MPSKTPAQEEGDSKPSCSRSADQEIDWLIAIPKKGQTLLYLLPIRQSQTGATIMSIIKKEYEMVQPTRRWFLSNIELEDAAIFLVS